MTKIGPGAPALIDLQTTDPEVSIQFYVELFGWDVDARDFDGYRYARASNGATIAGIRPGLGEAPSAWTPYFASDDVLDTAQIAARDGGQIVHGPVDVPGHGGVLLIADPTGAITGFWQPERGYVFAANWPGTFAWAELLTPDAGAADAFYRGVSGFKAVQIGDGAQYDYAVWTPAGRESPVAGRLRTDGPARWRIYFAVDPEVGTDSSVKVATTLGATTLAAPTDSPAGRIAVLADPTGAEFALLAPIARG